MYSFFFKCLGRGKRGGGGGGAEMARGLQSEPMHILRLFFSDLIWGITARRIPNI